MKKYIKQIAIFALVATLASCSSDDGTTYTSVGGNVLAKTSITRLDTNYEYPLDIITKEGVTASKIEIFKNVAKTTADPIILGDKVADAAINDKKATFNTSKLGSFNTFPKTVDGKVELTGKTGTIALAIVTTYSDGSTTLAPYTLTVGNAIVWKALNASGLPNTTVSTSGVSTIEYKNPTPTFIYYQATVKDTTKTTVVVEYAKGASKTYKPLDIKIKQTGAIDLAKIPYSKYDNLTVNDTITYRFTITGGGETDFITTSVQFVNQVFGAESEGAITNSNASNKFSFLTGKTYESLDVKNGEIVFNGTTGIAKDNSNIEFILNPSSIDYDESDLFAAEKAFTDLSGSITTAIGSLTYNNTILYRITRKVDFGTEKKPNIQDVRYYGLIKVLDIVKGETSVEIQFTYKEGVLTTE